MCLMSLRSRFMMDLMNLLSMLLLIKRRYRRNRFREERENLVGEVKEKILRN